MTLAEYYSIQRDAFADYQRAVRHGGAPECKSDWAHLAVYESRNQAAWLALAPEVRRRWTTGRPRVTEG